MGTDNSGGTNVKNRITACNILRNKYVISSNNKSEFRTNSILHSTQDEAENEKILWNLLDCEEIIFNLKIPPINNNIKYNDSIFGKIWHRILCS